MLAGDPAGAVELRDLTLQADLSNLQLRDAVVRQGYNGVWQTGCGYGPGHVATGLVIDRSRFVGLRRNDREGGAGVLVADCARRFRVVRSFFEDSDGGLRVIRHGGSYLSDELRIADNDFGELSRSGIALEMTSPPGQRCSSPATPGTTRRRRSSAARPPPTGPICSSCLSQRRCGSTSPARRWRRSRAARRPCAGLPDLATCRARSLLHDQVDALEPTHGPAHSLASRTSRAYSR